MIESSSWLAKSLPVQGPLKSLIEPCICHVVVSFRTPKGLARATNYKRIREKRGREGRAGKGGPAEGKGGPGQEGGGESGQGARVVTLEMKGARVMVLAVGR